MKLVEFTSVPPSQGPVFINPEHVVIVVRRYVGGATPSRRTTETTIGLVGDDYGSVDVMGSAQVVASHLAQSGG